MAQERPGSAAIAIQKGQVLSQPGQCGDQFELQQTSADNQASCSS